MEVTNVFFFLIICEPLYFLWDKLTQQRLASPATFINFLWQSLIPQQLGPTQAQGQSSPTLPAQPPSNYSGTLSESSNVKTWQGPPDRLSQLSAQLVQTVKVKSVVLFSLGRTGSIAVYIWLITATKMRLGLFFKLDSCVLVFPFKQRRCIDYTTDGYEMQISFVFCISPRRQMQRQNLIKNFPEHIKDSVDHLHHHHTLL